jgi:hypothetical protein
MPDSPDTRERSSFLGLSWFQVVAGALAAMTSAWVASALGVGGTIIGAALGSLVVTISSSLYASTLDRGRTLIVQTDTGRYVETEVEPGHTAEALAAVRDATDEEVRGAEVVEPRRTVRWKAVALTTAVVLAFSGLAIGGYELATGRAYGTDPDNARIGNPFGGGTSTEEDTPDPDPTPSSTPTPTATPTPSSTPTPTPTPTPTEDAEPTPSPSATATPDGS